MAGADVAELVRAVLVRADFEVVVARDGAAGLELVRAQAPELTVVGADCAGPDGRPVARAIRALSTTHIVLVADEADQVTNAGVDAVVLTPVRPRSLRAAVEEAFTRSTYPPDGDSDGVVRRLDASSLQSRSGSHEGATLVHPSRRAQPIVPTPAPPDGEVDTWVRATGLAIDLEDRSVEVDGRPVELSRTEFDLLASLVGTGRRVRSKADLVLTLRGQSYVTTYFVSESDKRAIEVHLANIRRKLGDVGPRPRWIETVRGVGYRMANA